MPLAQTPPERGAARLVATPAFADGRIYFRTQQSLVCVAGKGSNAQERRRKRALAANSSVRETQRIETIEGISASRLIPYHQDLGSSR